jgi:hypothetical protein
LTGKRGLAIEVEPRTGGAFLFTAPDGGIHIKGRVADWLPPRRYSCTWTVEARCRA